MKEQLVSFSLALNQMHQCCFQHLQANHVFLWPDCQTSEMISGLPAHLNVVTFPPPFSSSISTANLCHNLSALISGVAMCDTSWDKFPMPGPESRTDVQPMCGHVCVCFTCSTWWYSNVACHPQVIILFWEFKHVLLQQLPHLNLPQSVFIKQVHFVPNLIDIKLQASLTCTYILMKPWSHLFTSWFTLQSREVLNQRDFKTLFANVTRFAN